ncbi:hypothetical protein KCV01_g4529, partial [Aureobasidium melanogenum]
MADAWEAWHATPANVERGMDQCLAYLIDTQRQTSLQTRSDRFFRQAGLATHYSMQTFETGRASGLTPPVLDHLKGLSWIARGQAVVISGPALSGKTHLAAGIGQEAVIQGIRTTFIQTPRMLERCLDLAGHPAALRRYRRQLAIVPLLILDDFATEHSNTARTYELRRLIDERSRQCLPTVVASINDPRDWDGYFEDEAAREGTPSLPGANAYPGSASWPTPEAWDALKRRVGGRLSAVTMPNLPARSAAELLANPYYLGSEPALTQVSGWVDAWLSKPSAYVIKASNTSDVAEGIRFAQRHHVRLVVKGGGHSYLGGSNAPDSLLIWTRAMNSIVLHDDFVARNTGATPRPAVSVGAGCTWGQVYEAVTTKAGRYVQGGGCTSVGVAGLVQGGGFGSFSKAYGLAAASLLEAEIVTADGSVRVVNAVEEPDLFWALKGGGGGTFGVVTRLTLATHDLPDTFGSVSWTIRATSDRSFRHLLSRFIETYAATLLNPHWGEQVRATPQNELVVSMMFQGLDRDAVHAIWQPLMAFVAKSPEAFEVLQPFVINSLPARHLWDLEYLQRVASSAVSIDKRPGAKAGDYWWAGDGEQAGVMWHGYTSAWLPDTLLQHARQGLLVDAWFAATRHWAVAFHFNKGLAGATPDVRTASSETSINPQVLDAFALAIIAGNGPSSYPGLMPRPDVTDARRHARSIGLAMKALRVAAPDAGSYLSECDYFMKNWQSASWGSHYPRLLRVKHRLVAVWAYSLHIIDGQSLSWKLARGAPTGKRLNQLMFPFQILRLAREIILHAAIDGTGDKNLANWRGLAELTNEIQRAENKLRQCGSERLRAHDFSWELHPMAHLQFPLQNAITFGAIVRAFKIFGQPDVEELLLERMGMTMTQLLGLGFAVNAQYARQPYMNALTDYSQFDIPAETSQRFFEIMAIDVLELRERMKSKQSYDARWTYTFNDLILTPLIRIDPAHPERLLCPIPHLLFDRITRGVFFDIVNVRGFSKAFGPAFEKYVGEALQRAGKSQRFSTIKGTPYQPAKGELKHGADWIVSDATGHLFIECKSKRFAHSAKMLLDETSLDRDLETFATAVVQNYKNICDALAGLTTWHNDGQPVYPVLVTLEELYLFGPAVKDALDAQIKAIMISEDVPLELLETMPWIIASVRELEIAAQVVDQRSISDVFSPMRSESPGKWNLGAITYDDFQAELSTCKEILFPEELNRLFPWEGIDRLWE